MLHIIYNCMQLIEHSFSHGLIHAVYLNMQAVTTGSPFVPDSHVQLAACRITTRARYTARAISDVDTVL